MGWQRGAQGAAPPLTGPHAEGTELTVWWSLPSGSQTRFECFHVLWWICEHHSGAVNPLTHSAQRG